MNLDHLREHWNQLGKTDAMWAVLTDPKKRNRQWTADEFFAHGEREIAEVFEYLAKKNATPQKGRALDFGCGVGRISQALGGFFQEVTGVDIAASMIEQAAKLNRHGERCRYLVNAAPDLGLFPSAEFDFVYSNIVLQHMEPRYSLGYIREFVRILRPGGYALFQIPAEPARNAGGLILRFLPKEAARRLRKMEMHGVSPAPIEEVLREAGSRLLDRVENQSAGPNWISYRYLTRKSEL